MSDDTQEMRAIFLEEMAELVQDIEGDLLQLESAPSNRGLVDRLFRNLHTIKGGAGMAGLDALSHYTHAVENMLDEVRKGSLAMSSALVSLLLEGLDCLKGFMAEALGEAPLDQNAVATSHARILAAMGKGAAPAAAPSPPPPPPPPPPPHPEPAPVAAPEPIVPEPIVPEPIPPSDPIIIEHEKFTYVIQVFSQPDFLPLPSERDALEASLGQLGDLLGISHEHSLPPMEKRRSEDYYLWHSLHLVTEDSRAALDGALGDWPLRHKVVVKEMTLLPSAPDNQAQIDSAVDGVESNVLAPCAPTPVVPAPTPAPPPPPATPSPPADPAPPPPAEPAPPPMVPLRKAPPVAPAPAPIPAPSPATAPAAAPEAVQKLSSIRVDTGKLDKLVNLVGELITVEARLDSFHHTLEGADQGMAEDLQGILDDSARTLRELQDQAMTIRMVPIGGAFDPMQRLVRDYCRDSGKQIRLNVLGRDTEVDKKVSEQISGPLKHLIRNSLDHGIELPEDRIAAGKPPEGEITLAAYHQYGLIIIEVKDDGRGIDVEKVIASAKAKGIIDEHRELSEREALELIFAPAVSTAKAVTEVSGRGVGMDVVKRDIEALRGTVEITSSLGKGTTMTVRIPLTLSIIDGLMVTVGEQGYIIPLSSVEECVELLPGTVAEGSSNFLDIRDELVPFLRLRSLFGVKGAPPPVEKVVIVSTGERRIGLVVDHLLGDRQTVIKSLSRLHKDISCFSGATILGDGSVVLILDVLHLIEFGQSREERLRAL